MSVQLLKKQACPASPAQTKPLPSTSPPLTSVDLVLFHNNQYSNTVNPNDPNSLVAALHDEHVKLGVMFYEHAIPWPCCGLILPCYNAACHSIHLACMPFHSDVLLTSFSTCINGAKEAYTACSYGMLQANTSCVPSCPALYITSGLTTNNIFPKGLHAHIHRKIQHGICSHDS